MAKQMWQDARYFFDMTFSVYLLIFKSGIGCDMTSMVHSPEQELNECWSFPIPSSLCGPDGALA